MRTICSYKTTTTHNRCCPDPARCSPVPCIERQSAGHLAAEGLLGQRLGRYERVPGHRPSLIAKRNASLVNGCHAAGVGFNVEVEHSQVLAASRTGCGLARYCSTQSGSTLMPDLPTVAEMGLPGYEGILWI